MKYKLLTEKNESGNTVFSKQRNGKSFIYFVITSDGYKPVTKEWIIQNQGYLSNVNVSGDNLFVKESKRVSKYEDFGEKIGGARKDRSSSRVSSKDTKVYLQRDKLWKTQSKEDMLSSGYDKAMIYFVREVKKSIPKVSPFSSENDEDNALYSDFVLGIKEICMKYKTIDSYLDFIKSINNLMIKMGLKLVSPIIHPKDRNSKTLSANGLKLITDDLLCVILPDFYFGYMRRFLESDKTLSEREKFKYSYVIVSLKGSNYNGSYFEHCSFGDNVLQYVEFTLLPKLEGRGMQIFKSCDSCIVSMGQTIIYAGLESMCKSVLEEKLKSLDSTEQEVKQKERKSRLQHPVLSDIQLKSPHDLNKNVDGDDFIKTFGIRGGEYGNWVTEEERKENLAYAFISFRDLAYVLQIPEKSISLGNKLNIAFGSRGLGYAVAHYELEKEVINLTRMKGAGSLAHEYFHAIDNIVGKSMGKDWLTDTSIEPIRKLKSAMWFTPVSVSVNEQKERLCKSYNIEHYNMRNSMEKWLVNGAYADPKELDTFMKRVREEAENGEPIKYNSVYPLAKEIGKYISEKRGLSKVSQKIVDDMNGYIRVIKGRYMDLQKDLKPQIEEELSKYYENAKELSKNEARLGHDYWDSTQEMAARAFACYVKDKLASNGYVNDYLCGHADLRGSDNIPIYPEGEERKRINAAFDELFAYLRENFFK